VLDTPLSYVRTMKKLLIFLLIFCSDLISADVYQSPEDFVKQAFADKESMQKSFWLTGEHKQVAKDILGHKPYQLKVRYWGLEQKTVWILEEIGKEQLITVGIIVEQQKIQQLKVLAYRESRGYEVRYPFFTDQFKGRSIDNEQKLDQDIDGISGATLSVNALRKLARLALYLHQHSPFAALQSEKDK